MTGNKQTLVIQDRDKRLLRELRTMRVIDREQAKLVAGFHSTTRANARLLALTRAGFLKRIFVGSIGCGRKAVYAMTPKSTALVGTTIPPLSLRQGLALAGNPKLEHQMRINFVFITVFYRPTPFRSTRWRYFLEPLTASIPLIPDGYFEIESVDGISSSFLEIDLGTEPLKVWEGKARHYVQLAISGEYSRIFRRKQFRVLVLTTTEKRMQSIRETVLPITEKIFRFSTFEIIEREGFWSPIWLRPFGDLKQSLF
jgi:hypothetical protein